MVPSTLLSSRVMSIGPILAMSIPVNRTLRASVLALLAAGLWPGSFLFAQEPASRFVAESDIRDYGSSLDNYVVGPTDVLAITAPDDPSLAGTFEVEADLTFTYPLIGRVQAGGRTLQEVESEIVDELTGRGFYLDPQIMVTVEEYRVQNVFIVGEVHTPGAYAVSASMPFGDVLALAGSPLPSAGREAVIVPQGHEGVVVLSSAAVARESDEGTGPSATAVTRVRLDELAGDLASRRVTLNDGDTVFVLPAERIYVLGHVAHPGAYPMQEDTSTVSDGLALAGGATALGATSRIEIGRIIDGESKKIKASLDADVLPGDTIVVPQRRF